MKALLTKKSTLTNCKCINLFFTFSYFEFMLIAANRTNSDSQASQMKANRLSEAQLARFEVIEQEKEILEEEHQQSMAHFEDL